MPHGFLNRSNPGNPTLNLALLALALTFAQPPEPPASDLHRRALAASGDSATAIPLLRRAAVAYDDEILVATSSSERVAMVRNRARCLLALGDLGAAIASLRPYLDDSAILEERERLRAEIVWPNDDELVALARIEPDADRPAWYRRPAVVWAVWSAVWVGLLLRLGGGMRRRERIGWATILVGILVACSLDSTSSGDASSDGVIGEACVLRAGNGEEYPSVFRASLPSGVEVKILSERRNWLRIRLRGGKTGWIPVGALRSSPQSAKNGGKSAGGR